MKHLDKVVYIAGPITAATPEFEEKNVQRGYDYGLMVWRLGAVAHIPHLNTPGRLMIEAGITADDIYNGDLTILDRCDAMLRIPGWENSKGVKLESEFAQHHSIPIFDELIELAKWLESCE